MFMIPHPEEPIRAKKDKECPKCGGADVPCENFVCPAYVASECDEENDKDLARRALDSE